MIAVMMKAWYVVSQSTSAPTDSIEACATALTSIKAHVVEVDTKSSHTAGLGISIPPRSSSLARIRPRSSDHDDEFVVQSQETPPSSDYSTVTSEDQEILRPPHFSRPMAYRPKTANLNFESPRGSPNLHYESHAGVPQRRDSYRVTSFQTYEEAFTPLPTPDVDPAIIAALDRHWAGSSTEIDERTMMAMRHGLRESHPPITYPSPESPKSPYSPYTCRCPRSEPITATFHHQIPSRTPSSATARSFPPLAPQYVPYPQYPPPSPPQFSAPATEHPYSSTDLSPLQRILPHSTPDLRFSLYAALVTHKFLLCLNSTSTRSSDPRSPQQTLHSIDASMNSVCEYQEIPSKAASRLGLPQGSKLPLERRPESMKVHGVDVENLREKVMRSIRSLLRKMEGGGGVHSSIGNGRMEEVLIRALVELVD